MCDHNAAMRSHDGSDLVRAVVFWAGCSSRVLCDCLQKAQCFAFLERFRRLTAMTRQSSIDFREV